MTTAPPPRKSDLGVRTASAVVMIAVAGSALWLGGYWWTAFVAAVALGVLWEWWGLVRAMSDNSARRAFWALAGLGYVGSAGWVLNSLRNAAGFHPDSVIWVGLLVLPVIATDVCAYFAGRTFGGPKIAPKISPSKTWSGLAGGMAGAGGLLGVSIAVIDFHRATLNCQDLMPNTADNTVVGCPAELGMSVKLGLIAFVLGALIALVAQVGDFFESWMKRRAGVKDSSSLIPGHGGLFDRVDGLLAVCFVIGLVWIVFVR